MLAGAHKKIYRVQHAEIYLLDLKVKVFSLQTLLGLTFFVSFLFLFLQNFFCLLIHYNYQGIENSDFKFEGNSSLGINN